MILIVSNESDLTTDYIVLELKRRQLPFIRLNSEWLAEARFSFDPTQGERSWHFDFPDKKVDFSDVRAGYYRRPGTPNISDRVWSVAARQYCLSEWNAVLAAALDSLAGRWLNSPRNIQIAENKPLQLAHAHKLGFAVPSTFVTNDGSRIRELSREGCVVKPVREALIDREDGEQVIFTTRIGSAAVVEFDPVSVAPVIVQREIVKSLDIRVTIVGTQVFATEISSQDYVETEVDWRRGNNIHVRHAIHRLPGDISDRCVHMVQLFNLRFGAIDLIGT